MECTWIKGAIRSRLGVGVGLRPLRVERTARALHSLDDFCFELAQLGENEVQFLSERGHNSYAAGAATDWRDGAHDDLVLAAPLACWYAEQGAPYGSRIRCCA